MMGNAVDISQDNYVGLFSYPPLCDSYIKYNWSSEFFFNSPYCLFIKFSNFQACVFGELIIMSVNDDADSIFHIIQYSANL